MRNMLRASIIFLSLLILAGSACAGPYTPGIGPTLDTYLQGLGSPLYGLGAQLFSDGALYSIDPRLVVAIAGAQSNYGLNTSACPNDAWGLLPASNCGGGFASYSAGVDSVFLFLSQNYLVYGFASIQTIGASYCAGPCSATWTSTVTNIYTSLGGDPTDLTFTAGGSLIDFEQFSGPCCFVYITQPLQPLFAYVGNTTVTFTGGAVLSSASNLPADLSSTYGTASYYCLPIANCLNTITIDFSAPVFNFSVFLINGDTIYVSYIVVDDLGNYSLVTLPPNYSSGSATVALPPTDHLTEVQISGNLSNWDFFIDNVSFSPTQ